MGRLLAFVLASTFALAQTFDVSSVKQVSDPRHSDIKTEQGNLYMYGIPLRAAIQWAYHVQSYQLSGPEAVMGTRANELPAFDIVAKSQSSKTDEVRVMLQHLLADRFGLKVHTAETEMAVFVVDIGPKGLKMQPSKDAKAPQVSGQRELEMKNVTMALMLDKFSMGLGAPLIDNTGLGERQFDGTFTIAWQTPDEVAPGIISGLRGLGLIATKQKRPVKMLVIDTVSQLPTAN